MRGAEAMVIVVGNPANATYTSTTADLLKQWGRRMWTFPEILLSQRNEVKVYTRSGKLDSPLIVPKKQFAAEVWTTDATVSRQLIDHYDGTLHLSRLELVVLALLCLQARQTTQYLPGDHSYALMGLLRLRPQVDDTDSAFQAFARYVLSNIFLEIILSFAAELMLLETFPYQRLGSPTRATDLHAPKETQSALA